MHAVLRRTQDLRIGMVHIVTGYQDRFPRYHACRHAALMANDMRVCVHRNLETPWGMIIKGFGASVPITTASLLFDVHLLWESTP
jgi:hypothetical protein